MSRSFSGNQALRGRAQQYPQRRSHHRPRRVHHLFQRHLRKVPGDGPEGTDRKHTTDVIENSRMHIVAKTGIPEINHPHQIMGRNQIVQRIPISIDGKLSAVFGQVMFEDIKDVQILADKLNILESKVQLYEKELANLRASKYSCRNIVGESTVMQDLRKMGQRAAKVNSPVLLVGESGTGKELFAHAIHRASDRHKSPLIRLETAPPSRKIFWRRSSSATSRAPSRGRQQGKAGQIRDRRQGDDLPGRDQRASAGAAAQAAARCRREARRPPRGH